MSLSVVEVLERLGGVATRRTLLHHVARGDLDRALRVGDVVPLDRTRIGHPGLDQARRLAARLGGVVAASDAAALHGWEIARRAARPHVVVPRGRTVPADSGAQVHRVDLDPWEHEGLVTTAETTLLQSARWLAFPEALAIADSALRHGVSTSVLQRLAARAAGPGSPKVRRVAQEASSLAANPFESVLRAICLDVPGLSVAPQVWVSDSARADLVDVRLRIVVEADSFAWHGGRGDLVRDARRYNQMVVDGWLVLRFTYDDVTFRPDDVRRVLAQAVAAARASTHVRRPGRKRA